jgi:hypothetical protein
MFSPYPRAVLLVARSVGLRSVAGRQLSVVSFQLPELVPLLRPCEKMATPVIECGGKCLGIYILL